MDEISHLFLFPSFAITLQLLLENLSESTSEPPIRA